MWVYRTFPPVGPTPVRPAEKELSLLIVANCTKAVCFAGLGDCYGELGILAGAIKELGLSIVDDSEETQIPNHASIPDLPPHEGDTFADAEFLAGELAKRVSQIKDRSTFED